MAPLEPILWAPTRAIWCRQRMQSARGLPGYQQGTPADFAEQATKEDLNPGEPLHPATAGLKRSGGTCGSFPGLTHPL
jgi:hypothetical protein